MYSLRAFTICLLIIVTAAQKCPFADLKYFEATSNPPGVVDATTSYFSRPASTYLARENSFNSIFKNVYRDFCINPGPSTDSANLNSFFDQKKNSDTVKCGTAPTNCLNDTRYIYYRSMDGSCNNLKFPGSGMSFSRFGRLLRPNYVSTNPTNIAVLPSARLLSLSLYGEQTFGDQFRTMAAMQWGQFVGHDISMLTTRGAPADCCETNQHKLCDPIPLLREGPISYNTGKLCLNFARSISDADADCPKSHLPYNEKISIVTAYLDLSSLYGNTESQSNKVRLHKNGLLKTSYINSQHWLPISQNTNDECGRKGNCFSLPDIRNQFTPNIAIFHTLLVREHNRIALQLARLNPHHNDEQLFQQARKINIGQYQKITYYDWLPMFMGTSHAFTNGLVYYANQPTEYINDYNENVNVAPLAEAASAALRYAHTQIPGWFSLVSPQRNSNQTLRLSDFFDRPNNIQLLTSNDNFEALIRGLATQLQKQSDSNIDPDIKHHFDRKPFDEYGSDLKAIDIQRGRDFGLRSYNDLRQFCGLPRASHWSDFSNEIPSDKIFTLQKLYLTPDDVELSVGGSLEKHAPNALFGPTFLCILSQQFIRTRVGDRFFFEHESGGFTPEQLAELRKSSLAAIICNNANFLRRIQPNIFIFPNTRNSLALCNEINKVDLSKWQEQL